MMPFRGRFPESFFDGFQTKLTTTKKQMEATETLFGFLSVQDCWKTGFAERTSGQDCWKHLTIGGRVHRTAGSCLPAGYYSHYERKSLFF